ncbi:unnamed protein product, partial [Ectocarpus fasciculatus]
AKTRYLTWTRKHSPSAGPRRNPHPTKQVSIVGPNKNSLVCQHQNTSHVKQAQKTRQRNERDGGNDDLSKNRFIPRRRLRPQMTSPSSVEVSRQAKKVGPTFAASSVGTNEDGKKNCVLLSVFAS